MAGHYPPRLRILLVEDDPGDARLVELSLSSQSHPYRLVHVGTLAEAAAAKDDVFDIILLDLSLPDSFGFDTVTAIRRAFPRIPIIVLTGLDDPAMEDGTVASGAQDYLLKGAFDEVGLMRAIRHAIVRHRLERQLAASEAEHRAVVNLAPDAILVVSPTLEIVSANPAAGRILGDGRGLPMAGLKLGDVLPDAEALIAANPGAPEMRGDGKGIREGADFPVAMAIAPLGDGRYLINAIDITDRVRLTAELYGLARTDPLTGLANRRAFTEAIEAEFNRSRRFGNSAAVLMVDIDHFKAINDHHGHNVGDRALENLASVLKRTARTTDFAARFGGEEFVLLLAGTDLTGATEMAERIRKAVMAMSVPSETGEFGLTVSIGVSVLAAGDADWSDSVRRADQALYRAKAAGRNAVAAMAPPIDEEAAALSAAS